MKKSLTTRRTFLSGAAASTVSVALTQTALAAAQTPRTATSGSSNFQNAPGSPIDAILKGIPLPRMATIETSFDRPVLANVGKAFREKLQASGVLRRIRRGMTVAVGAGSRGITDAPLVTKILLEELKRAGAKPFIFPAMGAHGGATSEGQRIMLERMGFSEASMGVPVRCTMEVVEVGTSTRGLPAFIDTFAAAADAIVVVNRIKPHTSFRGDIESGLVKMIVIGTGKQKGAETCHNMGYEQMEENLLDLCRTSLATGKFLFGVGLVENAFHETARVEVIAAENILKEEPALLVEARKLMPSLPIPRLDVLVIDEIGKNISGTGLDPNIVGRYPNANVARTAADPEITRVAILDITDVSDGNGAGLGIADYTTERVFRKFSFIETYCNLLTSTSAPAGKIPMVLANDRQAIQAAIKTAFLRDTGKVRLARIRNTLTLDRMMISESLIAEARANPRIKSIGAAEEMRFDSGGNFVAIPKQARAGVTSHD